MHRLFGAEGLWVVETPLRSHGIEVGRRMTVVRLSGGGLFLHSPARLTPGVRDGLATLGPVRFVVSPNKMHHFFMEDYARAYPQAAIVASPGLPEKRRDMKFHAVLGDAPDPRWAADLEQTAFTMGRLMTEIVFFHRRTRTLVLTDLCFNFGPERPFLTRLVARAMGVYRRFGTPRILRFYLADRGAARSTIDRILRWDFDRVIIGHGDILESGGHEALRHAFSWLPPA